MSAIVWLVWLLILIILIYAFFGVFAFIPYFFGVLYNFISFPLDLISEYIYPVWDIVYTFYIAWLTLVFFLRIFHLFKNHN